MRLHPKVNKHFLSSLWCKPEYQVFLREAQRAHARQDFEAEHYYYRRVLFLLRGDLKEGESVTGNPASDRRLRECIRAIMSTD